jgi:hypothetical protein
MARRNKPPVTPPCTAEVQLPALHDAADTASVRAQKSYLLLVRLNLIALFIGAAAGAFALPAGVAGRLVAGIAAVALVVALLLTMLIQSRSYERTWYGGRAVAESVKTLAWRYMTRAEPFATGGVDDLFVERLTQILQQGKALSVALAPAAAEQITRGMRDVRGRSLEQRRDFYVRCRIEEQGDWYTRKAALSDRAESTFFALVWLSNGLSIAAAIVMVIWPSSPINATGVFSTAAASVFAWLQVRRHQELAQSYAVTAQELGLVRAKAGSIADEKEFAVFVADAEAAISREHTLWVARRDAGISIGSR